MQKQEYAYSFRFLAMASMVFVISCSRTSPVKQGLEEAAKHSSDADGGEAEIRKVITLGPSARPELLGALYDRDVAIRRASAVALAEGPDRFDGLDVPAYERTFPADDASNSVTRRIFDVIASEQSSRSRQILKGFLLSHHPDKQIVFAYCVFDQSGVATMIRSRALPGVAIDDIRHFRSLQSLSAISSAISDYDAHHPSRIGRY